MKLDGLRQKVFLDRYALKDTKGAPLEKNPQQMWRRVARAIATVEKKENQKKWEREFYEAMKGFKYVPGGRILAGAGTGFAVTFYNCFVIPSPPDSRDGILETLKQMVEIMAHGGGVGINLSSLRPRGDRVKKVNGFSSGPCNWAELFSVATKDIIQQGGCFTGDTRVMTHRGLVPIEEIVKSKGNFFASTHKGLKRITAKFDNGEKEVFEIETVGGYKVKTTAEHKFLTFGGNGRFYLKPLSHFKVGDHLVHLLSDWNEELPYTILNTNVPAPSKYSYGLKEISLPKVLNEDLAFILGAYDSDGSRIPDEFSPHGKGLRIAVAEDRPIDLQSLILTIQRCFNIQPKIRKGDGKVRVVQVFSRRLNELLKLNGLLKESSVTVRVPEHIFTSPRKVVEAYIAGVFLGDGTNRGGKGGLRITTVSELFARDLQLLLLNLGIPAKIKVQLRKEKNWRTLYTVTVNGATFMQKFIKLLSPYTQKVFDNKISIRNGFFGWPFNIVERFIYVPHFQRTQARTNPTTSQKSVLFLQEMAPVLQERDRADVEFLANCVPDKIASINYVGEENVYDLEVEDVHLLSGNGFYTSNSRRGALMLMLWDWHPDIEEFITVKQDLSRINGANLSVCASDSFMEAVENDADWQLMFPDRNDPEYDEKWDGDLHAWRAMGKKVKVYKTIKARYLWDLISHAAWRSAEPGVVFMERYNKLHNNWYWNRINCVNPCGEEGLPPWGVCNLGSINLSALVKGDGVGKKGAFDFKGLRKLVRVAVRLQDDIVDMDPYVFEGIRKTQLEGERRIGLGTMGLGDALIKLRLRYGSSASLKFIDKVYRMIRDEAYRSSVEIAREKNPFPKFDKELYPKGLFIQQLPKDLQEGIQKYGIRNSVLLMQAPTGTTSLLSHTTSGIEPVFEFEFIRRDRLGEHIMRHHLYEQWYKKHEKEMKDSPDGGQGGKTKKPEWFVSANDLIPEDHVRVQAVIQKYVDASISKTVNAPTSHTVDDVKKLYTLAYKLGCKGVTYMREGSRAGVLERKVTQKEKGEKKEGGKGVPVIIKRPVVVHGLTYQTQTPLGHAFITINSDSSGNPFELFVTIGKSGSDVMAMAEALGRMISIILRLQSTVASRERIRQIVEQLAGIGGVRTVGFGEHKVRSLPDAVAKVLAEHFGFKVNGGVKDNGSGGATVAPKKEGREKDIDGRVMANGEVSFPKEGIHEASSAVLHQLSLGDQPQTLFDLCPSCGDASLAYEEACKKCYSCGYSEC